MTKKYKSCTSNRGKKKKRVKRPYFDSIDVNKMVRIMKKYDLKQIDIAAILKVDQSTVSGWMHGMHNSRGKIKSKYFQILKAKGYQ